MKRIALGLFLVITIVFLQAWLKKKHTDQTPYLGSKTPYSPQQDSTTYEKEPTHCKPIYLSMLTRHGSRTISSHNDFKHVFTELDKAHKSALLTEKGENVYTWLKEMNTIPELGLLTE